MAKKDDDAPDLVVCDGCGMQRTDVERVGGLLLCEACEDRRSGDPTVVVQGRSLTVSELMAQAEDDEDLRAVLPGDSLQEQIDDKQALANVRELAERWRRGEASEKSAPSSSGKARP